MCMRRTLKCLLTRPLRGLQPTLQPLTQAALELHLAMLLQVRSKYGAGLPSNNYQPGMILHQVTNKETKPQTVQSPYHDALQRAGPAVTRRLIRRQCRRRAP